MAEALLSAPRGGGWLESALGSLDRRLGGPARRRVIALLASVLALQSADFGTVGAVATQLERAFHIHHAQLGLLASSSLLVGALATVPAGVLTDRLRQVRLLAGTIALWSVAMVAMGAAPSFGFEMVARLGLGAVGAAAGPAVASLTGDLFPRRERARIYGFVLTGELVGAAFGFLISGNVAAALSWRFAFWVLAIPSAALAWALPLSLPEPARGGASRLPSGAKRIPTEGQDEPEEESEDGEEGAATVVRELGVEPDPDRVLRADPHGWDSCWPSATSFASAPTWC